MSIPRLLVVDDDADMRQMMVEYTRQNGFMTHGAANREEIDRFLSNSRVDLILLDVMLGNEDGIKICDELRKEKDVPIIMVSALSSDDQRMQGYEVGADDYITKPFNPELLLARIKAVLRRGRRSSSLIYRRNTSVYRFQGWTYYGKKDEVIAPDGFLLAISKRESSLLKVFLANPHIPLTREEIASTLDGSKGDDLKLEPKASRAIDVLVGRLRSKLEEDPKNPKLLRTNRGLGYVFSVDVDVSEE